MEKLRQYISSKTAFFAALLAAIVFLLLFFYVFINQRKLIYNDSKLLAQEISRKAAVVTEKHLSSALAIAQSLKQQLLIVKNLGGNRNDVKKILKEGLEVNKNILATWALWEPNAFDSNDAAFKRIDNPNGILGVGFFKYQDSIYYERMTSADYLGPHYLAPKESLREVITEPYRYVYSGYKQVFYGATISIPIIYNNTFKGAIGVDVDLKNLREILDEIRPYEQGYLSLITSKGTIVTHYDSTLLGKNVYNVYQSLDSSGLFLAEHDLVIETKSEFTDENVLRFFYPISISENIEPWLIMVEIPAKKASLRSAQVSMVAFIILLFGLLLLALLFLHILERKQYDKAIMDALNEAEIHNKHAAESDHNYQEIFNSTTEAIFIHDVQTGKILDVNEAMLRMYGYSSKEEVFNLSITDFSSGSDIYNERGALHYLKLALTEGIQIFEWNALRKNGETFWVEVSLRSSLLGGQNRILAVVRDITERKNAQSIIEQSEKKFRELSELLPQVVWEADLNAKFTYSNRKGLDLFGYEQRDIGNGISILDVIVPEHRQRAAENLKRLFDGTHIDDEEYIGLKKDGTRFPIEIYPSIIYSQRKPVGLRGITLDISERKAAEKALRESEEKYRTLMESMNEVVIMADNNHIVHYVNRKFTEILGYQPEEIVGKEGYKILHDPDDFKVLENANNNRIDKMVSSYELTFKTKDGRKLDFLVSGAPLYDSEGNTYGSIGSMMDITERKKVEKALRESEEKYRTLMENMNEVIMLVDNDDRVLYVNKKFQEKLGYTNEEVIGKIGYELLLDEKDKIKIVNANKDRLSNITSQYEATFVAKNGQKVEFLVSGAPILNNDGETVGSIGAMMDISDRKKAERKLRESQQLFETLALMSPVGIFRTRADGYTTYVNPKWCELSGLTYPEALGDGWLSAVHPDDRERLSDGWKHKTSQSEKSIAEYRFIRSDGSIVWVLGNALPEIVDGDVKGYIGTITNITELKNAQEEIVRSEKKFREMADLLPQTIWEADINGRITYANNNGYKYLGYSPNDFEKGLNILSLIIPEDRERAIANIQRRFNSEKSLGEEYIALRKDGTTYPVLIYTSPIIENGKPVGIRGISIDMTEAKKAQKELVESEERYRTITEAFPDIIMITDLNGNIVFANDMFEKVTGIKSEEYRNPNRIAHIHPDDIEIVRNAIADLLKSDKTRTDIIENRFIDSKGTEHWFSGTISKLVLNNQTYLQTITRDITEKKNIEKELEVHRNNLEILVKERTAELEIALKNLRDAQDKLIHSEKMASLGVLAAGIAHEINNPLNFIQGGICGLDAYIREMIPEHLPETEVLIDAVHEGIRRSAEIVQSLNRYSRKDEFPRIITNVHSIIDSCLVMVHNQLKNRIDIKKKYCCNDILIQCNEGQIHQAFLNIIINAIHAIEDKGQIRIETSVENNRLTVMFSDNGCGISKDNLLKITDPFFTTKDPGKGTGLGLSITYNIISEHQGTLDFESEQGVGTTVKVSLPFKT